MSAQAASLGGELALLDGFLRRSFGLTVSAYPSSLIRTLLDELPPGRGLDHPEARAIILRMLAIHETYFFRHPDQLQILPELLLPMMSVGRPLRVWSACCATGEEAYTLSVIMQQAGLGFYEVLGTDLDPEAIRTAREGRYRRWSLRGLDPDAQDSWLAWEDDVALVRPHIREPVSFAEHNLMSPSWPGGFDLILCRNALIYFDAETIRRLYTRFFEALRPGGILMIAASDPAPPWQSGWSREVCRRHIFFRRPVTPVAPKVSRRTRRAAPRRLPPRRPPAPTPPAPPTPSPTPPAVATLVDLPELVRESARALGAADQPGARRSARKLLAQAPDGIIPNLLVGLALGCASQYAAVRLKKACDLLAVLPDEELVPLSGGMTAGQILTLLGDDNGLSSLIDHLQR